MAAYQAAKVASSALYQECYDQYQDEIEEVLLCITNGIDQRYELVTQDMTSWLLVLAGAMVFIMQLGFSMLCAGCVRRKNVSNTLLKNLLDTCLAAIAFVAVGYAFAYGADNPEDGTTFVGSQYFFLSGFPADKYAFFFYQYTFAASAVTIIAGTLEERLKMSAYLAYSLFMAAFVYPVVVHSIWSSNGFLSAFSLTPFLGSGCLDFAGGGVVHLTGGTTALVATSILGARKGRFTNSAGEQLEKPKVIPGHSISLQMLGTLTLWFGWYGFNCGSALLFPNATSTGSVGGAAATSTTLSGAAGAIGALILQMQLQFQATGETVFDLTSSMNGSLAGLVAITAGSGFVEPWAAVLIGITAGTIYVGGSNLLIRLRIDDAVDGVPVHCFCGMWGLLAVGLLASPDKLEAALGNSNHVGFFYSLGSGNADATLLLNQFLAVLFILGWTTSMMTPFFWSLSKLNWLRSDMVEEIAGLDASYKHATQEDHEELKEKIIQEYRLHKNESHDRSACTTSLGPGSRHTHLLDGGDLDGSRHSRRSTSRLSVGGGTATGSNGV